LGPQAVYQRDKLSSFDEARASSGISAADEIIEKMLTPLSFASLSAVSMVAFPIPLLGSFIILFRLMLSEGF